MKKSTVGLLFLFIIAALFGCNEATDTSVGTNSNWGNGRGNPQNTGLVSAVAFVSSKISKTETIALEPEWVFSGSGSPNGSYSVIDSEGTIYYQGADLYLYAVKQDGTLKWKLLNSHSGFVSPAIGPDGRIYVGDFQDWFYCLDPNDGQVIWSKNFGSYGSGFVNAPIITSDGMIYISSLDGNLYAIDLDGNSKWKFNQAYSFSGTPGVAKDGTIYAMTDRLYALNSIDGSIKWQFIPSDSSPTKQWLFDSSPVIANNGNIYILGYYDTTNIPSGHFIYLFAIDNNGNETWRYNLLSASDDSVRGNRTYPTITRNGNILVSVSARNTLIEIDKNGQFVREKTFVNTLPDNSSPSVDKFGNIYISYMYGYACINEDMSTILWEKFITDGSNGIFIESTPSIGSNSVYFTSRDGNTGGELYSFPLEIK